MDEKIKLREQIGFILNGEPIDPNKPKEEEPKKETEE